MGISIRAARQDDANTIAAICQTVLGYDCDLTMVTSQLARIQLRESERVWVACDERTQRIMGFIHLADYETLFSGSMKNIIALAVSPADQGKGIGRLLIQTAEDWAWKNGCVGYDWSRGSRASRRMRFICTVVIVCAKSIRTLSKRGKPR